MEDVKKDSVRQPALRPCLGQEFEKWRQRLLHDEPPDGLEVDPSFSSACGTRDDALGKLTGTPHMASRNAWL